LDFAGISPAHAEFVRRDSRLTVVDYPVMFVAAVVWNLRRPPFDDVSVRRAVTMALDRQTIVDAYLYGFGVVAEGPVPPEHPWYEPVPSLPYDRAAANALLNEAGWPMADDGIRARGGSRLELDLMTVGSGDNALEQMIQAQLQQVGVDVTIRQLELATFLAVAQGANRDFDALVTLIPGDLSLGYVATMFEGVTPGPLAYPGLRSAEFDAALGAAQDAASQEKLAAAWARAQRILAAAHPTTWLYHARGLQGVNRRVLASPPDLRGELANITEWRIDQGGMP
jgi:peptide/nickel transport system substrate-binding protein